MNVEGKIVDYDGARLVIVVPFTDEDYLVKHAVETVTLMLNDGRTITDRQRRYIYALLRDISLHTGHQTEFLKDIFKAETLGRIGGEWFSLSDCSMTQANELIETLIEFCIEWRVPTKDSLLEIAPDIQRYIYCCLKHKICCITQREGAETDMKYLIRGCGLCRCYENTITKHISSDRRPSTISTMCLVSSLTMSCARCGT